MTNEDLRQEAAMRLMVEFTKRPDILRDSIQEMKNRGQITEADAKTMTTIDFAADRAVVFADALIKRLEK